MRFIKAFQILPEGRTKDRLRCLFYNRRMRKVDEECGIDDE